MSEINILSEVYHTRVIGEYGTWITLILTYCYANMSFMLRVKVNNVTNILSEFYFPKVINKYVNKTKTYIGTVLFPRILTSLVFTPDINGVVLLSL